MTARCVLTLEKTAALTALVCAIWIADWVGKHTYDETVRVAERLAAMRDTTPQEIAIQTTRNAASCFGPRVAPTPIGK